MKPFLVFLLTFINLNLFSFEKLADKYCVAFGKKDAPYKVVEYFSFACPHCVALFKKDFETVKKKLIEEGKVYWVFHPVPLDLSTIQAMICLEKLSHGEKQLFLDAILGEADLEDSSITACLMQKAMEVLHKPLPQLLSKEFISSDPAFQDAFLFLKQKERIEAIPAAEINGRLFPEEIPENSFIEAYIKKDKS